MEKRLSVLVTPEKSAAASVQFPQGILRLYFPGLPASVLLEFGGRHYHEAS